MKLEHRPSQGGQQGWYLNSRTSWTVLTWAPKQWKELLPLTSQFQQILNKRWNAREVRLDASDFLHYQCQTPVGRTGGCPVRPLSWPHITGCFHIMHAGRNVAVSVCGCQDYHKPQWMYLFLLDLHIYVRRHFPHWHSSRTNRSRLISVEDDFHVAASNIKPRIQMLSLNKQAQPSPKMCEGMWMMFLLHNEKKK